MRETYPVEILNTRRVQIDYTQDQKRALLAIEFFLKSNETFFLLSGNAGTGKTTIAENVALFAEATMLAPTNAAVKRLKDKLMHKKIPNERFKTLHQILYGHPDPDTGEFLKGKDKGFNKNQVYIIDESSMIDLKVMDDIIEEALKKRAKIIFMGDDFQLEPVGKDPKLFEWENSTLEKANFQSLQRVKLNEVRRNDGSILKIATHLRQCKGVEILNINAPDFSFVKKFSSKILTDIREDRSYAILVATNKDRIKYNQSVRKVKYGNESVQPILENERLMSVANELFTNGEQYTITRPCINKRLDLNINVGSRNYPKLKDVTIFLVTHGVVGKKDNFKTVFIPDLDLPSLHAFQLMSNKKVFYNPWMTEHDKRIGRTRIWKPKVNIATYGYTVSVHKSQGNEWDNIYIDCSWLSPAWNKARWMYTAITRAKKRVELKLSSQFKIVKEK